LMISDHLTDLDSIRNWIDLEKMQGVSHWFLRYPDTKSCPSKSLLRKNNQARTCEEHANACGIQYSLLNPASFQSPISIFYQFIFETFWNHQASWC
jgi:hypothetical protein